MANELILETRLDSAAAEGLRARLVAHQGDDLALDASNVEVIGGLCLEVILSAQHHWKTAGHSFSFSAHSANFHENLARFGLDMAFFKEAAE